MEWPTCAIRTSRSQPMRLAKKQVSNNSSIFGKPLWCNLTMKFSTFAVLAVVAPTVTAFAPPSANQRLFSPANNVVVSTPSSRRGAMSMDLSDLEAKATGVELGAVSAQKAVKKSKPTKEAPKKKEQKSKPAPEPKKSKPARAQKPAKVVVEEPPKALPKPKKAKVERKAKVVPAPVPVPAASVKKIAPPKTPSASDPLATPVGIAAGAAPLLLTPVVLLGAGRNVLAGTKANREKIQEEMALKAKLQKKKLVKDTSVDGGALAQAVVSTIRNCSRIF